MTTVIFLDIDGVLLPFGGDGRVMSPPDGCCSGLFPDETMIALTYLLESVPNIQLVLSSTWRVKPSFIQDIRSAFRQYGYAYGGPLLEADFVDTTHPELHSTRQEEIYEWLNRRGSGITAWLAIDDEDLLGGRENAKYRSQFRDNHVVRTTSCRGLTLENAKQAVQQLRAQLAQSSESKSRPTTAVPYTSRTSNLPV